MAYVSGQRKGPKLDRIVGDASTEVRDKALALWGAERPALMFGTWRVAPPVGERQRLIWWKEGNPGWVTSGCPGAPLMRTST